MLGWKEGIFMVIWGEFGSDFGRGLWGLGGVGQGLWVAGRDFEAVFIRFMFLRSTQDKQPV